MKNSPSEILSALISAVDIAFPDCNLPEKVRKTAEMLEQAANNLSESKNSTNIMLNGNFITQKQFDAIYKGYGEYAVAKNTYKNFRESILFTLKRYPDFADQIIKALLNIKEN
jgi:hypothetical protein